MKRLLLLALSLQALAISASASTVTWGSQLANSLGLDDNTLANGTSAPATTRALVRLGYFTIDNATIQSLAAAGNKTALNTAFVEFGVSRVGNGYDANGVWDAASVNATPAFVGQRIYYWTFNAPTLADASQWGIFTNPTAANWVFPSDTPVPGSTVTDLSQVPKDGTGLIVGTFGGGPDPNFGTALYRMVPVPEPSAGLLAVLGLAAIASRRRRGLK